MLLRLAYLGVTNALALLRLLPMSDRDKDTEILVLRHQIAVLQRQLGAQKPSSNPHTNPCTWPIPKRRPFPESETPSPARTYRTSPCAKGYAS